MLFIVMNCVLKVSFWKWWQAALFGVVCGVFVAATYPYAILQSKTQIADYLGHTVALQDMAVVITIESVICFAYCVAVLRGWFGQREKWWVKPLKWYPSLLVFPVLFYLQTELIFSFPGCRSRRCLTALPLLWWFCSRCCVLFSGICCLRKICGWRCIFW